MQPRRNIRGVAVARDRNWTSACRCDASRTSRGFVHLSACILCLPAGLGLVYSAILSFKSSAFHRSRHTANTGVYSQRWTLRFTAVQDAVETGAVARVPLSELVRSCRRPLVQTGTTHSRIIANQSTDPTLRGGFPTHVPLFLGKYVTLVAVKGFIF